MDLFTREPGPLYVPAFAGRLLLAMARGIARATDRIKGAFADEDAEAMWNLAMVVVQWYADNLPAPEAKAVAGALQEFGVASIASNLNFFRDRLLPFVRTAHQAQGDAQLAAAGVYFIAAVDQIGLSLLQTALKAGPVRLLQQKILARLPLPEELKAAYYQTLGTQPKGTTVRPAAPPPPSRADRFDRADFRPRPARSVAPAQSTQRTAQAQAQARPEETTARLPRPPAPRLAQSDVTRAYLFTLGWEGAEVDRFLKGPDGKKRA